VWAMWNSLRAVMSLPLTATRRDGAVLDVVLALVALLAAPLVLREVARRTLRARRAWLAWGLAWFALSSATLVTIFPLWAPNRSHYGSAGLGIAVVALADAAHPAVLAAVVAARLVVFAASPAPPREVRTVATPTGAFMDMDQLTRLQRLMRATRGALRSAHPTLPHGARVVQHDMPWRADYAFGGSHALQAWYRDTTLRWVRYEDFERDTTMTVTTVVQGQADHEPAVALVDPLAMRDIQRADAAILREDWVGALARLAEARQRVPGGDAAVALAMIELRRAMALASLGRAPESERAARAALAHWPRGPMARYWIALALSDQGRPAEAVSVLDSALAADPDDMRCRQLRGMLGASASPAR
jgi:hypothetical protein